MQAGNRQYRGLWDAFRYVVREEGVAALYKGVWPTTQRATVVALLTLPTYDFAKGFLLSQPFLGYHFSDNTVTHLLAGAFSCVVSVYGSQPIDVVKSRIMNQPVEPTPAQPHSTLLLHARTRGLLYRNSLDCFFKTAQQEGVLALWKGTVPNLCRNAPWLIVFWLSYEWMKKVALRVEGKVTQ